MEIKNKPKLIFVWIGESLPKYALKSLIHAVKFSECEVILLSSSTVIKKFNNVNINIKLINISEFYIRDLKLNKYDYFGEKEFWDGFWIKTIERFYILDAFVSKFNIKEFFHVELDNVVFKIDELAIRLNKFGKGIFAPKDAINRVVGSFIYINNPYTLKKILLSIDTIDGKKNDMYILGNYFNIESDAYALPIENIFLENFKEWEFVPETTTQGLFDANAIGQYILGVDPRLVNYSPVYNYFINENTLFELKKCHFSYENNNIYLSYKDKKLLIYNIHIHSKFFQYFSDTKSILKLIKIINLGKKYIVGKHYRILYVHFIPFLRFIKSKIKILLK
jgi:hypothetical protein